MRTAQELFNVIQGKQNESTLVDKVPERCLSSFVKLSILVLQLLMLDCKEAESIAGADYIVCSLSSFRHNLAVSLFLPGKLPEVVFWPVQA